MFEKENSGIYRITDSVLKRVNLGESELSSDTWEIVKLVEH